MRLVVLAYKSLQRANVPLYIFERLLFAVVDEAANVLIHRQSLAVRSSVRRVWIERRDLS